MSEEEKPLYDDEELQRVHEEARLAEKHTGLAAGAKRAKAGVGKRECEVCENGEAHGPQGPPTWNMQHFDHTLTGNVHQMNHWANLRGRRIGEHSGLGWHIPLPDHEDSAHHHETRGFYNTIGHPTPKTADLPENIIHSLPIDMETTQRLVDYLINTNHPLNIFHEDAEDDEGNNIRGFHDHELNMMLGIGDPDTGALYEPDIAKPLNPVPETRSPPIDEAHTWGYGDNTQHAYENYSSEAYPNIGKWLEWQHLRGPHALLQHAQRRAKTYAGIDDREGPHQGLGKFVLDGGRHKKTPCQLCLGHGTVTAQRALWWMSHFENYPAMNPSQRPVIDQVTGEPMVHTIKGAKTGKLDDAGNELRYADKEIPYTEYVAHIDTQHPEYEDTVNAANDHLLDHSESFGGTGWNTDNPLQEMKMNKQGEYLCPSCAGKGVCSFCDGDGEVQACPPSMDAQAADQFNHSWPAFKHAHDIAGTAPMMPFMRGGAVGVRPSFFQTEPDPSETQWSKRPRIPLSNEQKVAVQDKMARQQDLTRFSQGLTAENRAALESMFPDFERKKVAVSSYSTPQAFWDDQRAEARKRTAVRSKESQRAREEARRKRLEESRTVAPMPGTEEEEEWVPTTYEQQFDEAGGLTGFTSDAPTPKVGVVSSPVEEVNSDWESHADKGFDDTDTRTFKLVDNRTPFENDPGLHNEMLNNGEIPKHFQSAKKGTKFGNGITHGESLDDVSSYKQHAEDLMATKHAKQDEQWAEDKGKRKIARDAAKRDKKFHESEEGRKYLPPTAYDAKGNYIMPLTEKQEETRRKKQRAEESKNLGEGFSKEISARRKKQWQDMRAKIWQYPNAMWKARDEDSLRYALFHQRIEGTMKQNGSHIDNGDLATTHNESGAGVDDKSIYASGAAEMALFRLIRSIHPDWMPEQHEDMAGFPGQFMDPPNWNAHTYQDVIAAEKAARRAKSQKALDAAKRGREKVEREQQKTAAPMPKDDDVQTSKHALLRDALVILKFYDARASTRERVGVVDTVASVSSLNHTASAHLRQIGVKR